ncbi:MAG: NAD(P)/FAD-dependent oxidoreductase [Gammaproteobacteria bacterium]|jgi:sulfide dehydrogenase [flavocytochrome c] flavoprotein subunit
MTTPLSRRQFLKMGGVLASAVWPLASMAISSRPRSHVVVVGGGFGGATCAKYIKKFAPNIEVTLIERDRRFVTCPFSNLVLAGVRDMASITHGYDNLKRHYGINVVYDEVTAIDAEKRRIRTKAGTTFDYDRAVVSPGIDFLWDEVEGYSADDVTTIPHAWTAGEQTALLKRQLTAMDDGGTVIIVAPPNPFRCPPGPYERASLIAHYLKRHKRRSKVIILDAKDKFSKKPLFTAGWEKLYPGVIEWVPGTGGGIVSRVDAREMTVYNEVGEAIKGDVINFIPHQRAGTIARQAGLTDSGGWCPVNQKTFASRLLNNIHVIGDSAIAAPLPKSGYAANSEGKMCAAAVVAAINDIDMPDPSYSNTCYSLVAPDYGISVAAVYRLADDKIVKVKGAGGLSPEQADDAFRQAEALYATGWYSSITQDMFS